MKYNINILQLNTLQLIIYKKLCLLFKNQYNLKLIII